MFKTCLLVIVIALALSTSVPVYGVPQISTIGSGSLEIKHLYTINYGFNAYDIKWAGYNRLLLPLNYRYENYIAVVDSNNLSIVDMIDYTNISCSSVYVEYINGDLVAVYRGNRIGIYSLDKKKFLWIDEDSVIDNIVSVGVYENKLLVTNMTHYTLYNKYTGVSYQVINIGLNGVPYYAIVKGEFIYCSFSRSNKFYLLVYDIPGSAGWEILIGDDFYNFDVIPSSDLAIVSLRNGTIERISLLTGDVEWARRIPGEDSTFYVKAKENGLRVILYTLNKAYLVYLDTGGTSEIPYFNNILRIDISINGTRIAVLDRLYRLAVYDLDTCTILADIGMPVSTDTIEWVNNELLYIVMSFDGVKDIVFMDLNGRIVSAKRFSGELSGIREYDGAIVIRKKAYNGIINHVYLDSNTLDYLFNIEYVLGSSDLDEYWDTVDLENNWYIVYYISVGFTANGFKVFELDTGRELYDIPSSVLMMGGLRMRSGVIRAIQGYNVYEVDLGEGNIEAVYSYDWIKTPGFLYNSIISISPDLRMLAYVSYSVIKENLTVRVIDMDSNETVYYRVVEGRKPTGCVEWSDDGRFLLMGFVGSVLVVDISTGNEYDIELGKWDEVSVAKFSPNNNYVAILTSGAPKLIVYSLYGEPPLPTKTVTETRTETVSSSTTIEEPVTETQYIVHTTTSYRTETESITRGNNTQSLIDTTSSVGEGFNGLLYGVIVLLVITLIVLIVIVITLIRKRQG